MTDLAIDSHSGAGFAQLTLTGEFDLAGIDAFQEAFESAAAPIVVVDLSGLAFMDSSGLRALVAANDRAQRAGRRLVIVPGPPHVRRVFEVTQMDRLLEFVEDVSALSGQ